MKKLITVLLIGIASLSLIACGGESPAEAPAEKTEEVAEESGLAFDGQKEVGEGTIYLINESGTTEDGNVIWIMDGDYMILQIGLEGWDMDGSKPTVIYVDGKELESAQLSDSQTSIELEAKHLGLGEHNVEAVQKDGAEIVFYRLMKYKVE